MKAILPLSLALFASPILAESPTRAAMPSDGLSAPVFGLLTSPDRTALLALTGVPEAAIVSAPVPLTEIDSPRRIHLAPGQEWALIETANGIKSVTFHGSAIQRVQDVHLPAGDVELIGFSPSARTAVLILAGLPTVWRVNAATARAFAMSESSRYQFKQLAADDSGDLALGLTADGQLVRLQPDSDGLVLHAESVGAVTFLAASRTAVATVPERELAVAIDLSTGLAASRVLCPLPREASSLIGSSKDGRRVLAASAGSGFAISIDIETQLATRIDLGTEVNLLERIGPADRFLFSAGESGPVWSVANGSVVFAARSSEERN